MEMCGCSDLMLLTKKMSCLNARSLNRQFSLRSLSLSRNPAMCLHSIGVFVGVAVCKIGSSSCSRMAVAVAV